MKIVVLRDVKLTPLPDCTAEDAAKALADNGFVYRFCDLAALEKLDRTDCDILVAPYCDGEFGDAALDAVVRFHSEGGSLLFLGDLPHHKRHYPYRNMLAYRLLLTRSGGGQLHFEGLSGDGKRLFGELPDLDYLKRKKRFRTLRVTAFPPDATYNIFDSSQENWEDVGVVLVRRHCRKFMGAKFGIIGTDGGEPRESVCGAYPKPWKYDSGYLDREWKGRDALIAKFISALEPERVGTSIELKEVTSAENATSVKVVLRNLTDATVTQKNVVFSCAGRAVFMTDSVVLAPHETREIDSGIPALSPGIYPFRLSLDGRTAAERTARVMRAGEKTDGAFGASTFWAFDKQVAPEYFIFVENLIDCGAQYIRANIPWENVEPEKGVYDWTIPDQIADFAREHRIKCKFWMFPTTRGSGLSDGGVPVWTLEDAAIDRNGNRGFFPTIWGELYQKHYFAMLEAFLRRYAHHDGVSEFILDHGNSDFPYGYYCYGNNDHMIFDYSPAENRAFRRYLKEVRKMPLEDIRRIWGRPDIKDYDDIPTPFSEERDAWMVYCAFRGWTNEYGFVKIGRMLDRFAPDKRPDDLPGHGLGSISDIGTCAYEVRARHYDEEMSHPRELVAMHNAGRHWGGEPWQVAASFEEYDPALFGSIRFHSTYFSIPGADLGIWGDDVARCGYIRLSMAGATRRESRIAVIDGMAWNDFSSLAHMATRLDVEADLLTARSRFDFSCYQLLLLPPDDAPFASGKTNARYLPTDREYYRDLAEAVRKGLTVVIWPQTGNHPNLASEKGYLRAEFELTDVCYGERLACRVDYPEAFGGGTASGMACGVTGRDSDTVLLSDENGRALLRKRQFGKGAILLPGFDTQPDSFDGERNYFHDRSNSGLFLNRLIGALGLKEDALVSGGANLIKCLMTRGKEHYFLLYSHLDAALPCRFQLKTTMRTAFDLSTGKHYALSGDGEFRTLEMEVKPFHGYYLLLQEGNENK